MKDHRILRIKNLDILKQRSHFPPEKNPSDLKNFPSDLLKTP